MALTPIQATDSTLIPLPPEAVWPLIADIGRYPQWWPRSLHARADQISSDLIGTELHLRPPGSKPFTCKVVAFEEPHSITLEYVGSFITGEARWLLEPQGQGTRVSYVVDVAVQGTVVALVARVIDLKRLHSSSMTRVLKALHRQLFPTAS